EGENLIKLMERSGNTIGSTLRSAWAGQALGQENGSAERTRRIEPGSYALGLVIGLQYSVSEALFSGEGEGMPHRFLFCEATDPNLQRGKEDPGTLDRKSTRLNSSHVKRSLD